MFGVTHQYRNKSQNMGVDTFPLPPCDSRVEALALVFQSLWLDGIKADEIEYTNKQSLVAQILF